MSNEHGYDMETDYVLLDFEDKKPTDPTLKDDFCPKCGKLLKAKGRHLHIRACYGNPSKAD